VLWCEIQCPFLALLCRIPEGWVLGIGIITLILALVGVRGGFGEHKGFWLNGCPNLCLNGQAWIQLQEEWRVNLKMSKGKERIAIEINKCIQITETVSY